MFTPRFFYNTDAPTEAAPNIAAIMAKQGALKQPGDQGPVPSINTSEKKEEPNPASATAPAPATATPKAEPAKSESPSPKKEPEAITPQKEEAPKVPTWQEVLKTQQPNAILKELGLDERLADLREMDPKIFGLLNHWKSKGDVKAYLQALDTDFQKMSPEDVMRYQLRVQNPELNAEQLDKLFKIKVINRYKLDPNLYSEDEVDEGRIELMADVKSIRSSLAEEQQKYLLPQPPEPKQPEADQKALQSQQEYEAYKSTIDNDPYTRTVLGDKKVYIGEGENKFSFPVDPNGVMEILYDNEKWAQSMFTKQQMPDGEVKWIPDAKKQILIASILKYGDDFLNAFANHNKSLGGKSAIDPIENAKPPATGEPAKAEKEDSNPAAAMAKRGRLVSGGFR